MKRNLNLTTLLVDDYDKAISFYRDVLNFVLTDDVAMDAGQRFVVVRPDADGAGLLLARAETPEQKDQIGHQTVGRVAFFLNTDDFHRDYALYRSKGLRFMETPRDEPYGTVAVFQDLYGNLWDLIQHKNPA